MWISGHLVPFPDIGAADLMSDHLEQLVQAEGPGKISCKIYLPKALLQAPGGPSSSPGSFACKRVEISRQEENDWLPLWSATTDSYQALEVVFCEVAVAGTFKCKVLNMSGMEAQFSIESTFLPYSAL